MKVIAITPDQKRDYTTELIIEGLKELDIEIIASDVGNGIEKSTNEKEILSIKDADFVISFFGKVRDNRSPKYHLLEQLKHKFKTVYVDGSEWTCTGYQSKNQMIDSLSDPKKRRGQPWINDYMLKTCNHYFKRECYPEDKKQGIIPLPFGLMKRHILKPIEKDIDVMCVFGQISTGLRKQVTDFCLELKRKTNYNIVVSNSLDQNEYKSVLSRSRIVIDAWGGGDNCDRFYEAIGAEACCVYQKYNVIVENPFLDFEHAVSYHDMESFSNVLNFLLKSKEKTIGIGKSGKSHGLKFHSAITRTRKIIETIL